MWQLEEVEWIIHGTLCTSFAIFPQQGNYFKIQSSWEMILPFVHCVPEIMGRWHPQLTWRGDRAAVLVICMLFIWLQWRLGSFICTVENTQIRQLSKTNCVWQDFPPLQLKLELHPVFGWLGSKQNLCLNLKVGCPQCLMSVTNCHAFRGL